jgi:DNA-directed RNA polymerase
LKLLNNVTDPTFFRIPHKGIYRRELESMVNLYHRQVLLEEVSSTQSHDKLEEIFESLMKLNKVQEAQVVRKFIIDWFVPLTGAIKEEQSRCSAKELTGNRKHYGEYLVKIDAEKLATLALTQLII